MVDTNILKNTIICGDCLEVMKEIPEKSIHMILCDLPYGVSENKWDIIIPLDKLWEQYERIITDNGAIVLTANMFFSYQLIHSNPKLFRYDLVWIKTIGSGNLNVGHRPLRMHENILVFYKNKPTYNEQTTVGKPYRISRKADTYNGAGYGEQKDVLKINDGTRHATSVLKYSNPRTKGGHPTQKPVELFEWLIKTYTNENEIVLDNCIGSGTTAVACINTDRNYIGIELEQKYVNMSNERIASQKIIGMDKKSTDQKRTNASGLEHEE
jgi:site-specific DNA-methyltransferase (adenine-specific)